MAGARVEPSSMRYDGLDDSRRDGEREPEETSPDPLDAAESTWDPWLWALYLRELAEKRPPTLH